MEKVDELNQSEFSAISSYSAVRGGNPDGHWYANFRYYNHGTDFPSYGRGVPAKLYGKREHAGYLAVLNLKNGPDDLGALKKVSESLIKDPYPINEDYFLVVNKAGISGISVMNAKGRVANLVGGSFSD